MSDTEHIKKDLVEYLDKEPNLRRDDRLSYLQTIFHKHLEIKKLEHLVTHKDLFIIFSEAKKQYIKLKTPLQVSAKELEPSEVIHMAVIEAFLLYLGRFKLLNKFIRIDYRDMKE
jgi:hypothetical protein